MTKIVFLMLIPWPWTTRLKSIDCSRIMPNGEHWCVAKISKASKVPVTITLVGERGARVSFQIPAGAREAGVPARENLVRGTLSPADKQAGCPPGTKLVIVPENAATQPGGQVQFTVTCQ